nr:PRC-barrel domain-containing protein [Methylobacterium brachythecii]
MGSLATAGEAGPAGQPEASPSAPATTPPPTTPAAPPPVAQPTGSAPAATPVQPPSNAANAPSHGTPALVLDTADYEGLLGKSVRAQNGDDLGRIIDVITDREGHPRAAIIDFGGFLGVGSRKIAVDWRVLKFSVDGKAGRVTLALNRNQVRVSPEYKTGEPIVVLGAVAPAPEGEQTAAPASQAAPAAAGDKPAAAEKPEKTPDK